MKAFFLYANPDGYGRVPLGLSNIMSCLIEAGHEVRLFDTTFLLANNSVDNKTREKANLVLPTDISHLYEGKSLQEIDVLFQQELCDFSPDVIGATVSEDSYELVCHFFDIVRKTGHIPIIVGGVTAIAAPHILVENSLIDYVCCCEGEQVMLQVAARIDRGKDLKGIPGLWYQEGNSTCRGPLPPFVDLNSLPVQHLEVWDRRHFVKPYDGRLWQAGFFEMSRGCLNRCAYCVNHGFQVALKSSGQYHREKSIENVMQEIETLASEYNFEMIFFSDENFFLMSQRRMQEFADRWLERVNLPYWIQTNPKMVNHKNLTIAKKTGCAGIGLGLESGSEWLRRNVLNRQRESNDDIAEAFDLIHSYDIRTTANNMIGFPLESKGDIFDTIKLNQRVRPRSYDVTFVAPYYGTQIYEYTKLHGMIDMHEEPGFQGFVKNITMREGSCIDLPDISHEELSELFLNFTRYVDGYLPIPDKYFTAARKTENTNDVRNDPDVYKGCRIDEILKKCLKLV